jgi:branched-chain amino acid transport system substrate-binding protein
MNGWPARHLAWVTACAAFALFGSCASKPEVVKIGAVLPLSGAAAEFGNQHLHGLQLAIEELNASNPKVRFELVADNDRGDQAADLAAFTRQLKEDKILVEFAATRTACLAVVPQAEIEFVPVFANCPHPLMTSMHLNAFRDVPSTALDITTITRFITGKLKLDRAAVLYADDDEGNDAAKAIRSAFPAGGVRLAVLAAFGDGAASARAAASAALAGDPGVVCVFGAGTGAAAVLAGLHADGYRGPVIGSSDFADPSFARLAGASLEGCYYPAPTISLSGNSVFAANYRKRFNAEPTAYCLFEYDAMRIVAKAVGIKDLERINISNALKKVGDFSGAGGLYTYADREWLPQMSMVQIKSLVPVEAD